MKTPSTRSYKFPLILRLCHLSLALLLSSRWCLADCPTTFSVDTSTGEITLDRAYQPYPTGTPGVLKCYRFVPPPPFVSPYPTVLMVPPNLFRNDMIIDEGEPGERHASYDLQHAGYLVFQVETRLAPPGTLPQQASGDWGFAPEQTDDLKRQILSALADPDCNQSIYLVGGSAGGTLALWCALDPASTVTGWDENARKHIKAVVSLSGPTQFCDWSNPGSIPVSAVISFGNDLENYVDLPSGITTVPICDSTCDLTATTTCALDLASPVWLVANGATTSQPAFLLYSTTGDPVPNSQSADMRDALRSQFPSLVVERWLMTYSYGSTHDHAFKYWPAVNNDPLNTDHLCVHQEVLNFLAAHP